MSDFWQNDPVAGSDNFWEADPIAKGSKEPSIKALSKGGDFVRENTGANTAGDIAVDISGAGQDEPTLKQAWGNITKGLSSPKQWAETRQGMGNVAKITPNVVESVGRGALASPVGAIGDINQLIVNHIGSLSDDNYIPTTEDILNYVPRVTKPYEGSKEHEMVGGLLGLPEGAIGKAAKATGISKPLTAGATAAKNAAVDVSRSAVEVPKDFYRGLTNIGRGETALQPINPEIIHEAVRNKQISPVTGTLVNLEGEVPKAGRVAEAAGESIIRGWKQHPWQAALDLGLTGYGALHGVPIPPISALARTAGQALMKGVGGKVQAVEGGEGALLRSGDKLFGGEINSLNRGTPTGMVNIPTTPSPLAAAEQSAVARQAVKEAADAAQVQQQISNARKLSENNLGWNQQTALPNNTGVMVGRPEPVMTARPGMPNIPVGPQGIKSAPQQFRPAPVTPKQAAIDTVVESPTSNTAEAIAKQNIVNKADVGTPINPQDILAQIRARKNPPAEPPAAAPVVNPEPKPPAPVVGGVPLQEGVRPPTQGLFNQESNLEKIRRRLAEQEPVQPKNLFEGMPEEKWKGPSKAEVAQLEENMLEQAKAHGVEADVSDFGREATQAQILRKYEAYKNAKPGPRKDQLKRELDAMESSRINRGKDVLGMMTEDDLAHNTMNNLRLPDNASAQERKIANMSQDARDQLTNVVKSHLQEAIASNDRWAKEFFSNTLGWLEKYSRKKNEPLAMKTNLPTEDELTNPMLGTFARLQGKDMSGENFINRRGTEIAQHNGRQWFSNTESKLKQYNAATNTVTTTPDVEIVTQYNKNGQAPKSLIENKANREWVEWVDNDRSTNWDRIKNTKWAKKLGVTSAKELEDLADLIHTEAYDKLVGLPGPVKPKNNNIFEMKTNLPTEDELTNPALKSWAALQGKDVTGESGYINRRGTTVYTKNRLGIRDESIYNGDLGQTTRYGRGNNIPNVVNTEGPGGLLVRTDYNKAGRVKDVSIRQGEGDNWRMLHNEGKGIFEESQHGMGIARGGASLAKKLGVTNAKDLRELADLIHAETYDKLVGLHGPVKPKKLKGKK